MTCRRCSHVFGISAAINPPVISGQRSGPHRHRVNFKLSSMRNPADSQTSMPVHVSDDAPMHARPPYDNHATC